MARIEVGPVFHLIYVSTATTNFGDAERDEVLEPARAFNAANDVTGLLLYSAGAFLQVLEGPQEGIEAAYERCASSARHRALLRTPALPIDERAFGAWSMGFERAAPTHVVTQLLQPLVDHQLLSGDMVRTIMLERFTALQHHT